MITKSRPLFVLGSLASILMLTLFAPRGARLTTAQSEQRAATTLLPSSRPQIGQSGFQLYLPFVAKPWVPTLELYGNIETMGIIASLQPSDDPDQNAIATVLYRTSGNGPFLQGFPLSRVSSTQFVGSLFWLRPSTTYDVLVAFRDPGSYLDGLTASGTGQTRPEVTVPSPVHSFYVSPNGSGTACSLAAACSFTQGISLAQPGDEVVLRGGVYYQGEITLPRSGKAGAPIVIRGYPSESAILDGADPATFSWASIGSGIYRTTVNLPDFDLVAANEQRLYPYKNMTDLQSLRWGIPGFYAEGTTLYVYLVGNSDPNNASMVVSRYSYAFWVEQNFIEIVNLTFRHYGRGMYHQAIYIRGGSDNLVQGNTFALNLYGIAIKHASHRNVIQNNEFYDSIRDWPWDAVYDGTLFTGSGGIRFVGPNSDQGNVIARGNIIRRNIFHDSFDGFGVCPGQPSGATTNETDVYENLVYNVGDDGMETDALCSNVRIWGNTFHDSLTGISLAPNRVGPVYALRNVIYRTFRAGGCPFGGATTGPCSGTAFKFQNQNPGSGPMYLFHNTADAGSYGSSMYISEPSTWPILVSRNNIWYSSVGWAIDNSVDDPVDFDYDDLVGAQGWNLLRWQGTKYLTLGAFCAATGEECHGKNVDPRFANRSVGDYRLLPDSQLIDAGALISGINDNFNGRAPDIGAFEY